MDVPGPPVLSGRLEIIQSPAKKEIEMKSTHILLSTALSLFAAAGAHAETYEGVHPLTSGYSRAEVERQAVATARAGNLYGDLAMGGVAPVRAGSVDRATVYKEAVATAHARGQNLRPEAFPGSMIPAQARSLMRKAAL